MNYTVEELSPVKRKIQVEIPVEEVDAALDKVVAEFRRSAVLPGFRKGKAPLGMIEKRFKSEIINEASSELINGNVSSLLQELDLEPVSGIDLDSPEPITRGTGASFSITFEIMPSFELPAYEGLAVDEEKAVVAEDEIDRVIERVRKNLGTKEKVEEARLPQEGDIVTMEFAGYDEQGNPVDKVAGKNFQVTVGEGQVIPDFEALVKTIRSGESGEGPVTFPEEYHNKDLAGKTVTMKITVNSLHTNKLPEINDDFAKLLGAFETVEAMREDIRSSYMRNRKELGKAKAQSDLLERLLADLEFPLPESMVERYAGNILAERLGRMQRQGADLSGLDEKAVEEMRATAKTEAEKFAKTQIFLLSIAKKEKLEVSPQEMEAALRQIAAQGNHDLKELHEHYVRNNLLPSLRDRLLADKAMDLIYDKATVNEVDPKPANPEEGSAATTSEE